jgi:hypothetical protein
MSFREELELAWRRVEATRIFGAGNIRLVETGVSSQIGSVLVGLDSRGRRHLCLPTTGSELGEKDTQSRGVIIEVVPLLEGSQPRPFVDVLCRDPKLNPLFAIVAADMLEAVKETPNAPFSTCQAILERWRQLLEKEHISLLSVEALGGLFAELLVLESLVSIHPDALSSWHGPESDVHDFVCGGVDIEVKSTRSPVANVVEVSDLTQLDSSGGVSLYLAFHRIHLAPGRGRSVPSIVYDLLELGVDRAELVRKLREYGYDQRDEGRYLDLTFDLLEERWHRIDDAFPRLGRVSFIAGHPPPEVKKIRYALDLAGVGGALGEAERRAVLNAAATLGGDRVVPEA